MAYNVDDGVVESGRHADGGVGEAVWHSDVDNAELPLVGREAGVVFLRPLEGRGVAPAPPKVVLLHHAVPVQGGGEDALVVA